MNKQMVDTYLLRSLKRIHDECERAISDENHRVNESIAERFNDVLSEFKQEYPNKDRIQSIEESEGVRVGTRPRRVDSAMDTIQETKLKSLKIADLLELDTSDFEELSERDDFAVININQEQTQKQKQEQLVTIEQIINDIDNLMIAEDHKTELKELVGEFEEELEADQADGSRLREIIAKAREYSDDVAQKLIMLATVEGFNILTGI